MHDILQPQSAKPTGMTGSILEVIAPLQPVFSPPHRVTTPEGLPSYTQLEAEARRAREQRPQERPSRRRSCGDGPRVRVFRPPQSQHSIVNHPYLRTEPPSITRSSCQWPRHDCGAVAHSSARLNATDVPHHGEPADDSCFGLHWDNRWARTAHCSSWMISCP